MVDVLLELAHAFGAEGVGNGLALARVLGSVAGVKQATLDRDEGVVVFPVKQQSAVKFMQGVRLVPH